MRIVCHEFKPIGIRTFVTALTKSDTGNENGTTSPWQVLQDTDRKSIEIKQKHEKKLVKVQKSNKRQTTGASEELWKLWVDFVKDGESRCTFLREEKCEKRGQVMR